MNSPNSAPRQPPPRLAGARLAVPYATAFVGSGCIMAVELLGGRLIARHVGSSLYTWTSLIGVVLGGIALGNYIGGRLADRYAARPTLAVLFLIAAITCLLVPAMNDLVGEWSSLWYLTWPQRIFAHVTLTFLLPATALGVIGPVVAKMALDVGRRIGRTVGSVYAWGAVGSIVGTYASGFFLIGLLHASKIIYLLASLLALMAIGFAAGRWRTRGLAAAALALGAFAAAPGDWAHRLAVDLHLVDEVRAAVSFDRPSRYSDVRIEQDPHRDGRRVMLLDKLEHSYFDPAEPNSLQYGYERVFAAVTDHVAGQRRGIDALILGGGGFTHPRYILHRRPRSRVCVAEIDPVVTEAAMAAFGLAPDPRMGIVHLDGRQYLVDLVRRAAGGDEAAAFDFVFLDAVFDYNVPFHLATEECLRLCRRLLRPDGVYMAILIDILDEGEFLGAYLCTTERVFEHVACYFADDSLGRIEPAVRSTFVVVASNRDLGLDRLRGSPLSPQIHRLLLSAEHHAALADKAGGRILTDDFAPVEQLLAPVVQRAGQDLHLRFYARGNDHLNAGRFSEAEADYRRAIEARPNYHSAHLNLGIALARQGRLQEALAASRAAAALAPNHRSPWYNLGGLFALSGDHRAAAEAFSKAVAIDPDFALGHLALGRSLASLGRRTEAIAAFERVLEIEPASEEAHAELGRLIAEH